jgi:hypothetical protein
MVRYSFSVGMGNGDLISFGGVGFKQCRRCKRPQVAVAVVRMECQRLRRYRPCRCGSAMITHQPLTETHPAFHASWDVATDAAPDAEWWRNAGDDESNDAGPGR